MVYHIKKRKDSLTILKAVLISVFSVITAVCSYFFYVIPGIKKAEENSWKYAEVHLTEPRIAISGVGYGNVYLIYCIHVCHSQPYFSQAEIIAYCLYHHISYNRLNRGVNLWQKEFF